MKCLSFRISIFFYYILKVMANSATSYLVEIIYALIAIAICVGFYLLSKFILTIMLRRINLKSSKKWVKELSTSTVYLKILRLVPVFIFYRLTYLTPLLKQTYDIIIFMIIAVMSVDLINTILSSINSFYEKNNKHAAQKPIKGLISVVKIIIIVIAVIIVLARILGQSPVYILTGLGALSAVAMLIFRDSILGFVAGFQMSTNDLVRIGDWIEMPKYGADGDVIDISLTFVKVRNWDKTIVTIPAYALVSDSFKNWRGMFATGGRRIKRAINIDVSSVSFCSDQLLERLSRIEFIKEYIATREAEIDAYNAERGVDTSIAVNGRHMTNLGIFRIYVTEYLKRHPKIHQDMLLMVRQLQNENTGIPLEVYAFTNDTKWVNYEGIMADIFDHLYAAINYFDLKVYQEPSGSDIKSLRD